jgi:hypothetical protein
MDIIPFTIASKTIRYSGTKLTKETRDFSMKTINH